jgi:hypothetical protein
MKESIDTNKDSMDRKILSQDRQSNCQIKYKEENQETQKENQDI